MNKIDLKSNIPYIKQNIEIEIQKIKQGKQINELSEEELQQLNQLYLNINNSLKQLLEEKYIELDDLESKITRNMTKFKKLYNDV